MEVVVVLNELFLLMLLPIFNSCSNAVAVFVSEVGSWQPLMFSLFSPVCEAFDFSKMIPPDFFGK